MDEIEDKEMDEIEDKEMDEIEDKEMDEIEDKEMDEVDIFLDSQVKSEEELLQEKCERTFKAASNPTRREILKSICFLGKSREKLLEITGIDNATLDFHTGILMNADFLFLDEDGIYRLTKIGLNVLPKL